MLEIDEELVVLEKGYEGSELTVSNLFRLAESASLYLKSSKPVQKEPNSAVASFELKNQAKTARF